MKLEHIEDIDSDESTSQNGVVLVKEVSKDESKLEYNEYLSKFLEISEESRENDLKEKNMSLIEGIKTYPKAVIWSVILCSTLIMEGYDVNLLNSLYTFPSFTEKFGVYDKANSSYEIPAKWQTSLSMSQNVGEVIGLFIAGYCGNRFGYRPTLMAALTLVAGLIFVVFFAVDLGMLLSGELLLGVPWGAFQTLCITYASDVCPMRLRIYLTTYANCCWVIGQLISSCVLRGTVSLNSQSSWKIPFGIQWVWPVPLLIGIYFAPESPWWLARKGRNLEAKRSLERLMTINDPNVDKDQMTTVLLNRIKMTLSEESEKKSSTSYLQCFKGKNRKRTIVTAMVWLIQNSTGSALMGYSTYFYKQAGLATDMSFNFSIIQYCLGVLGTLCSWGISRHFGRFTIYFYGLVGEFILMLAVGCTGIRTNKATAYASGTLLLVYTFLYDSTVGPLCYTIIAELPSPRLRTLTVVIARNVYNISGIVIAIISPQMLNPLAWNWKAKTGFFWAGFALAAVIFCWFYLPETKGRTFAELDLLFENRVNARKFKYTEVEAFNTEHLMSKMGENGIKEFVIENEKIEESVTL